MPEMQPTKHKSTTILKVGFEGERWGKLYVQFHDGNGNPTAFGYYEEVPKTLFNAMHRDRAPGAVLGKSIKNHFKWIPADSAAVEIDQTLPNNLFIPAGIPDDGIEACINQQRTPVTGGLF